MIFYIRNIFLNLDGQCFEQQIKNTTFDLTNKGWHTNTLSWTDANVLNPLKGKKLTNVRASGTDEAVRLTTPTKLSLEQAIAYIDDDELVEVTPNHVRLRKRILTSVERKRSQKIAS